MHSKCAILAQQTIAFGYLIAKLNYGMLNGSDRLNMHYNEELEYRTLNNLDYV